MAASTNSSCAPRGPRSRRRQPQNALQVRKPHLNAFTVVARPFRSCGPRQRPRDITRALIEATRNLAGRRIGTTLSFQWAWEAVSRAATIEQCDPVIHQSAACRQRLPSGADIGVGGLLVVEIRTRKGPVFSLGLVDDRNVRRDPFLLDQPVQHWRRSVGGVGREPLR